MDLGINFHTASKAYGLLRQEGLLRIGRRFPGLQTRSNGSGKRNVPISEGR
jgi:DNA-binding transcriptional regulator YhcF (GntR family)